MINIIVKFGNLVPAESELNAASPYPVSNAAVTKKISELSERIKAVEESTEGTEEVATDDYQQVTQCQEDWSGEYVITCTKDGSTRLFAGTDVDANYIDVSVSDGIVTVPYDDLVAEACMVKIERLGDNYSLRVVGGANDGKYMYNNSSTNNIKFNDEPQEVVIEWDDNDGVRIHSVGYNTILQMYINSADTRFRFYKTVQNPIVLCKRVYMSADTADIALKTAEKAQATASEAKTAANKASDTADIALKTAESAQSENYLAKKSDGSLYVKGWEGEYDDSVRNRSVNLGTHCLIEMNYGMIGGKYNRQNGLFGFVVGTRNYAKGHSSSVLGNVNLSDGYYEITGGFGSLNRGSANLAVGHYCEVTGNSAQALGTHCVASKNCAFAHGSGFIETVCIYSRSHSDTPPASYWKAGEITVAKQSDKLYAITVDYDKPINIYHVCGMRTVSDDGDLYCHISSVTEEVISNEDGTNTYRYVFIVNTDDSPNFWMDGEEKILQTNRVDIKISAHVADAEYSEVGGHCNVSKMQASHYSGRYAKIYEGSETDFTNGDALVVGNGTSHANRSNAFRVTFGGSVHANAEFNSTGADYAEYFEWEDGNLGNEDRIGLFVAITPSGKIKIAQNGDDVIGVVSGISSVVGNAHEDAWNGMYMRDVYGRPLTEEVDVLEETGEYEGGDEEHLGEPVMKPVKHTVLKVNPEYDSSKPYVPRSKRKEWGIVGLLGQLVVNDDGTCVAGQRCTVGENGKATQGTQWRVIKRLDENHVVLLASFL